MQNRILLIVVCFQSLILVLMSSNENTTLFSETKSMLNTKENTINVKNTSTNEISNMDFEEYIVGVVAAEMPASFNEEALKAQAVAARTYAKYKMNNTNRDFDVVTDVSNQAYITVTDMQNKWGNEFEKYYEKVKNAVNETKGEVLTYNGNIIEAFYFAMSNGYTEDSNLVFNENLDYLKSVKSSYDEKVHDFIVIKVFTEKEICEKLKMDCETIEITNLNRSETGRVISLDVNKQTFTGENFRAYLNLRSSDFEINKKESNIEITTKGFGHGVGMSQYGAEGMAINGSTYDEILKYFYQNVEIEKI